MLCRGGRICCGLYWGASRENTGVLAAAIDNMAQMASMLRTEMNAHEDRDHEYRKLEIWIRGLISSLDELEQSLFAASFFRKLVKAGYMDDMSVSEQGDYARYVYFTKTASSAYSRCSTSLGRC